MLPFTQSRIIGGPSGEMDSQMLDIVFQDEEKFYTWLASQKEDIEWSLRKHYDAPQIDRKPIAIGQKRKAGRPSTIDWSKEYKCPSCGTPRPREEDEGLKRLASKPSKRVGCTAYIKASKKPCDERVFVSFNNFHSGHEVNSLEAWSRSRLSLAARDWLQKIVATGMDWKLFKTLNRKNEAQMTRLRTLGVEIGEPVEVSDLMRISNQDFNNSRRKHMKLIAQLHTSCWESLQKYSELIRKECGIATLEKVPEDQIDENEVSFFAFCSSWQVEVFLEYMSILFLDSTHNTCFSLEDGNRKAFLYTILIKHDAAGCGVPVAFMITNSETQRPLANWLSWLRQRLHLPTSVTFMIDCSATEMAAIESAFEDPQIRVCYWHMLRAMRFQVNKNVSLPTAAGEGSSCVSKKNINKKLRETAIQDFINLMKTKTREEFNQRWNDYCNSFIDQKNWLSYIELTWMKHSKKWWGGNRAGMLGNNTNNYVESWHNCLKSGYLGNSRKQRTDVLVHILLREVLPDFNIKVTRVVLGLDRRRLSKAEKLQFEKSVALDTETLKASIYRSVVPRDEGHYVEVFNVKSFTNNDREYVVTLNAASAICSCSCEYQVNNKLVCKHMFLVQRAFCLSIFFDTRAVEYEVDGEQPVPSSLSELPVNEEEVLGVPDNKSVLLICEQMNSTLSYFKSVKNPSKEQIELLNELGKQAAMVKRKWESTDKSWAKKQRR